MSGKQQHPETRITINDTLCSNHSLYHYFIANLLLSLFWLHF